MASISDYFGQTGSATAPAPITTVKTARLVGETVLAYNSVPGFQENTPVFFVTYKKVTDPVTGEISAINQTSGKALANTTSNTLTNIVIAPGYTDIGNAVGDFLEVIPTSYWADSLVTGLAVSLNPNGTLKTGAVTSTAIAAGAVTTPAIADTSVTVSKVDFTTIRVGKATVSGNVTSTSSQSTPSAITGLSVTFTLTQTHTVRAMLYSKSLYNSAASSYNIVYICNGSASVANAFAQSNKSLSTANSEDTNFVMAEIDLVAGTYTFNGAAGRNTGTLTLAGPVTLTVDIVG